MAGVEFHPCTHYVDLPHPNTIAGDSYIHKLAGYGEIMFYKKTRDIKSDIKVARDGARAFVFRQIYWAPLYCRPGRGTKWRKWLFHV